MQKAPLWILTGWGTGSWVWASVLDKLVYDYDITFFDWDDIRDITGFSQKVQQLMEERQVNNVTLLGWSLGALVALETVRKYPSRIVKLIMVGGMACFSCKAGYGFGWPIKVIERMKQRLRQNPEAVLFDFYDNMFSSSEKERGLSESFRKLAVAKRSGIYTSSLEAGLDYLIRTDLRGVLKQIDKPMLLIHGAEDRITPLTAAHWIKNETNAVLKVMPEAGHVPFFSDPCLFLSHLNEFGEQEVFI